MTRWGNEDISHEYVAEYVSGYTSCAHNNPWDNEMKYFLATMQLNLEDFPVLCWGFPCLFCYESLCSLVIVSYFNFLTS